MRVEGTANNADVAAFSQAEPSLRDTIPSGIASRATGGGRLSNCLAAQSAPSAAYPTRMAAPQLRLRPPILAA